MQSFGRDMCERPPPQIQEKPPADEPDPETPPSGSAEDTLSSRLSPLSERV